MLNIGKNINRLRKEKKRTQQELANFLGVTKASVSKWETCQSMPDIELLPCIANYFDISVDELIGYEPQLSAEQIRNYYQMLSKNFAEKSFVEAMDESKRMMKSYYSCYPFLMQIAMLWFNHFMIAPSEEMQLGVLGDINELCDYIIDNCKDISICNDITSIKAITLLQMGNANECIELMEPLVNLKTFQNENTLVRAYQMAGNMEQAQKTGQINMYKNIMTMVIDAIGMISVYMHQDAICEQTIERINTIIKLYNVENINRNVALQFYYQAATYYSFAKNKEKTLHYIDIFTKGTCTLLKSKQLIQGDDYFDKISEWIADISMNEQLPRSKKVILGSTIQALNVPGFAWLDKEPGYKRSIKRLSEMEEYEKSR